MPSHFPPLMHFYIKCNTYDLSVIVEWRTAICGVHVRDTLSHYILHLTLVVIYKVYFKGLAP